MLSTNVIGQASKAAHYFLGLDNYYTQDVKDVQQKTHWYGQGAALLGLTGHVDKVQFRELLAGRLPNGEQLGLRQGETIKHRPGFDLTFSVPKSVSLLLAFSQDDTLKARVNHAVLDSVKTTLSAIEKKCAQARVTTQGVTRYVDTGHLTMALFQHDLSRANEPQTHIHAVVMNMTPLPSGTWRSLASSRQAYGEAVQGPIQGFMEQVRHQKRFYGLMQRAHLANALKEMGFNLTVDRKNGFFELAGFSDKTLATYSTRAQRIQEDLAEAGLSGAKAAAMMTTKNRPAKSKADEGTLKQEWQSKADAAGVSPEAELRTLLAARQAQQGTLDKIPTLNPSTSAREAIAYAIDYLSETTAKMSFNELMNRALQMSLGDGLSISALRDALDAAVLAQQLIPVQPRASHTQYVSPQQVAAEKTLLNNLAHTITPMTQCAPHTLPHYLASHEGLSQPLRLALETVAHSPRRITPLDRPHHANQPDLLGHLAQLGEALEQRVLVLTPTALSARQVKQRFQAAPSAWQTFFNRLRDKKHYLGVSQFFHQIQSRRFLPSSLAKTLILVEDAHRLPTLALTRLSELTENHETRLVLLGDTQQLPGYGVGEPFKLMMEQADWRVHWPADDKPSDNRQAGNPFSQTLTNFAHRVEQALTQLSFQVIEAGDDSLRLKSMAKAFVALSPTERLKTQFMMPTQAGCAALNQAVRHAFREQAKGEWESTVLPILRPVFFKQADYRLAKQYRVGQWVRFNETYASLGVQRGDYRQIAAISPKDNRVELRTNRTDTLSWYPARVAGKRARAVEVFEGEAHAIRVGERLRITRAMSDKGLHRNEMAHVMSVNSQTLTVKTAQGGRVRLSLKKQAHQHWTYGYAVTSQQLTTPIPHLVVYQPSKARFNQQRTFYHGLSQATQRITLYTDDESQWQASLKTALKHRSGIVDNWLQTKGDITLTSKTLVGALETLLQQQPQLAMKQQVDAKDAVQYAIRHLSEREAGFALDNVVEVALTHALGEVAPDGIKEALLEALQSKTLLKGKQDSQQSSLWTTPEAVQLEKAVLQSALKDKGQLPPLVPPSVLTDWVKREVASTEHQRVLTGWLGAPDRHVLIQGAAGTGKTTLLATANVLLLQQTKRLLAEQAWTLQCLAPTHSVVKELNARGLPAQTIDSFLNAHRDTAVPKAPRQLLVVDESSMISNQRQADLLRIVNHYQWRDAYIGDKRQYASIEAGKPFNLLQKAGCLTLTMTDIKRQKNPTLLKAVQQLYAENLSASFHTLESFIHDLSLMKTDLDNSGKDSPVNPVVVVANYYFSLSPNERQKTLVVAPSHQERHELSQLIRQGLMKEGALQTNEQSQSILVARHFTQAERSRISNYRVGDWIRFNQHVASLGVRAGQYLKVTGSLARDNALALRTESGDDRLWQLPQQHETVLSTLEVFSCEERSVAPGELIRWTRTHKEHGFINAELARVVAVNKEHMVVRRLQQSAKGLVMTGESIPVPWVNRNNQHWEHGYALTLYSAQGKTVSRLLMSLPHQHPHLTTLATFLVGVTRAVNELMIVTQDKQALMNTLMEQRGEKHSALEIIGEYRELQRPLTKPSVVHSPCQSQPQRTHPNTTVVRWTVGQVKAALVQQLESILPRVLGEPKAKQGAYWTYRFSEHFGGSTQKGKGSLMVTLQGEARGLWYSFKTGEGGHVLDLIQRKFGLSFQETLDKAANFCGLAPMSHDRIAPSLIASVKSTPTYRFDPQRSNTWSLAQKKKIAWVRRLVRESQPIDSTLAATYLQQHRGIHLKTWPTTLRYHPGVYSKVNGKAFPALLVINQTGTHQAVGLQAIYLDPKTGAKATNLPVAKQTFGVTKGVPVSFNHHAKTSVSFIAEGPETGLSVLAAYPRAQVFVTLGKGKMPSVDPKDLSQHIIIVGDNDGSQTIHQDYEKAVEQFHKRDKTVWLTQPQQNGLDFNDVHQRQGLNAVRQQMESAISMTNNQSSKPTPLKEILSNALSLNYHLSSETVNRFQQQRQDHQQKRISQHNNHQQRSPIEKEQSVPNQSRSTSFPQDSQQLPQVGQSESQKQREIEVEKELS